MNFKIDILFENLFIFNYYICNIKNNCLEFLIIFKNLNLLKNCFDNKMNLLNYYLYIKIYYIEFTKYNLL